MIFILVPSIFGKFIQCKLIAQIARPKMLLRDYGIVFRYAHAQKMTTPSRRTRGRAMASPTSVEVNLVFLFYIYPYVKSMMVLVVKRHIACPNGTNLCVTYGL